MTETYIYLSDNYGRRSGTERRYTYNSYQGEENRSGTDRRNCEDRRITLVDRRSIFTNSYESDRRSVPDRRGTSYTLFVLEGI